MSQSYFVIEESLQIIVLESNFIQKGLDYSTELFPTD